MIIDLDSFLRFRYKLMKETSTSLHCKQFIKESNSVPIIHVCVLLYFLNILEGFKACMLFCKKITYLPLLSHFRTVLFWFYSFHIHTKILLFFISNYNVTQKNKFTLFLTIFIPNRRISISFLRKTWLLRWRNTCNNIRFIRHWIAYNS